MPPTNPHINTLQTENMSEARPTIASLARNVVSEPGHNEDTTARTAVPQRLLSESGITTRPPSAQSQHMPSDEPLHLMHQLQRSGPSVVKTRTGSVLSRGFILKTDHYPSGTYLSFRNTLQRPDKAVSRPCVRSRIERAWSTKLQVSKRGPSECVWRGTTSDARSTRHPVCLAMPTKCTKFHACSMVLYP
jgi:hypothetical protein